MTDPSRIGERTFGLQATAAYRLDRQVGMGGFGQEPCGEWLQGVGQYERLDPWGEIERTFDWRDG